MMRKQGIVSVVLLSALASWVAAVAPVWSQATSNAGLAPVASPNFTGTVTLPDGSTDAQATNLVLAPAGTTTNPTLTFNNCGTNCGWYAPAANKIGLVVNGGLVGDYGITSATRFTINATFASTGNFILNAAGAFTWNNVTFLTSPASAVVHIGQPDAASPIAQTLGFQGVVAGTTNTGGQNASIAGSLSTGSGTSGDIILQTGGTGAGATTQNSEVTAMVIKGATQAIQMPGLASSSASQTGTVCWTTGTGNLTVDTTTTCLLSLEELKDIRAPIREGLAEVMQLKPFWYSWKEGTPERAGDTHEQPGLGAHQVEGVDPRLAGYGTDGSLHGVRYQQLTAVLVASIQEQQAMIHNLEDRLTAIEHRR
jgi:hypothetical protein